MPTGSGEGTGVAQPLGASGVDAGDEFRLEAIADTVVTEAFGVAFAFDEQMEAVAVPRWRQHRAREESRSSVSMHALPIGLGMPHHADIAVLSGIQTV